ncbi:MAG: hypothetical protein QXF61_04365 [Nitrososphaeria archaeon]
MPITLKEQKLLISMLNGKINSKDQKIFKSRMNFYRAIWKLRDMDLVHSKNSKAGDLKDWELTLDGIFFARILKKSEAYGLHNGKIEKKE